MADVRADGIAVYVWRWANQPGGDIELLQIRRSGKTGEYQHSWQIVYGGINPGEKAYQTAQRELLEETALVARAMHQVEYLESFYFMPHDYVLIMPVFAARVDHGDAITLNEEHDAYRWVHERDVPTHFMWRTQREAVRFVLESIRTPSAAAPMLKVI